MDAVTATLAHEAAEGAPHAPGRPVRSRPFLKWAGGKTRLLPRLLPLVPASFQDYYEPFVGGGAMFFAVRGRAAGQCHLSDLNEELVNAWVVARDHPAALAERLGEFQENDSKEFYYSVRPLAPEQPVDRAARFFYLNRTSWNGLWRVNRKGEFNVPWGDRAFKAMTPDDLAEIARAIAGVQVVVEDFRDVLKRPNAGDFVYLDPPYLPLSDTSKFRFYTQKRFVATDLEDLARATVELSERGVQWMVSNRDTPLVRELFDHGRLVPFTTRRAVAAQNRRNVRPVQAGELAIVGGPR